MSIKKKHSEKEQLRQEEEDRLRPTGGGEENEHDSSGCSYSGEDYRVLILVPRGNKNLIVSGSINRSLSSFFLCPVCDLSNCKLICSKIKI